MLGSDHDVDVFVIHISREEREDSLSIKSCVCEIRHVLKQDCYLVLHSIQRNNEHSQKRHKLF